MGVQDLQPALFFKTVVQIFCKQEVAVVKVKCILGYYDKNLKKEIEVGKEFSVTEERANQLIKAKVATPTTEKVAKAKERGKA